MDQEYDVIVLGTGLKECVLSGLLSCNQKTVLHMDRNNYYGGESASLNLEQLFQKFKPEAKVPDNLGRSRDYNVDLCPKFIMACGNLVKLLLHTQVTRYLEFRSVAGSYVYRKKNVLKVPATAAEALNSDLMGFFQKRNFKSFLDFVNSYDANETKIGVEKTNREIFAQYSLDENTIKFVGQAMALYLDNDYLDQKCHDCLERIKLYAYSVSRYGNSPYIYPQWGLGGLPEGFSRLCAIHGGVYMLNKPIDEILYDAEGKVVGVKSQGEIARCKKLLADPTYFIGTNKIRSTGRVARCIVLMNHPVPGTNNADSCQIIIPSEDVNRQSNIYISCVSRAHQVVPQGMWVAVIQLQVETNNPQQELGPALELLGPRLETFFWVSETFEPTGDGSRDNVFITRSYDATSHFESSTNEVIEMYQRIAGQPVDLSIAADPEVQN